MILSMEGIRRSPVEVGSLSHYLQGLYIPGGSEHIAFEKKHPSKAAN